MKPGGHWNCIDWRVELDALLPKVQTPATLPEISQKCLIKFLKIDQYFLFDFSKSTFQNQKGKSLDFDA